MIMLDDLRQAAQLLGVITFRVSCGHSYSFVPTSSARDRLQSTSRPRLCMQSASGFGGGAFGASTPVRPAREVQAPSCLPLQLRSPPPSHVPYIGYRNEVQVQVDACLQAFGANQTPAFGASSSAFGTPAFGVRDSIQQPSLSSSTPRAQICRDLAENLSHLRVFISSIPAGKAINIIWRVRGWL